MKTTFMSILANDKVRPDWVVNSFPIIKTVVVGVLLLCAVVMIIFVMLQQGNTNGMTGITGDSSDTFYNRNKGKSMQGKIKKFMIIDAVAMMILCIAYLVLNTIFAGGLV